MADAESQLIQELRALAGAPKGDSFEVVHDGVRIRVSYTGGSSSSLVLRVPYDEVATDARAGAGYRDRGALAAIRPMKIALRPETDVHGQAKEGGIDVEFQTGDPGFDRAVYVDTLTPAEVLAHVLEADARRAVLDLFAIELTSVTIDDQDRSVVATMVSFSSLKPSEPVGARAIDAFARLAHALPRVAEVAGTHPEHPLSSINTVLAMTAVIMLIGSVPLYFGVTMDGRCPEDMSSAQAAGCFGPGVIGFVFGLVLAVVTGAFATRFTRRYAGRSDSSRHGAAFSAFAASIAFFVTASVVALIAARR